MFSVEILLMPLFHQWVHFSLQLQRNLPKLSPLNPKSQAKPNQTKERAITVSGKIQINFFLLSSLPGNLLVLKWKWVVAWMEGKSIVCLILFQMQLSYTKKIEMQPKQQKSSGIS